MKTKEKIIGELETMVEDLEILSIDLREFYPTKIISNTDDLVNTGSDKLELAIDELKKGD